MRKNMKKPGIEYEVVLRKHRREKKRQMGSDLVGAPESPPILSCPPVIMRCSPQT